MVEFFIRTKATSLPIFAAVGKVGDIVLSSIESIFKLPDETSTSEDVGMKLSGSIELRNVSFFQPDESSMKVSTLPYRHFKCKALHGVNLDNKAGERVAIIVENGDEKQRFFAILRGISRPSQGQVI